MIKLLITLISFDHVNLGSDIIHKHNYYVIIFLKPNPIIFPLNYLTLNYLQKFICITESENKKGDTLFKVLLAIAGILINKFIILKSDNKQNYEC